MMANLNFVLLKINDIDVGQLQQHHHQKQQQQQDTVLNLLLSEENENIVLQLKRKACWNMTKNIDYCDEIEIGKKFCYLKIQQNAGSKSCSEISSPTSSTTTAESPEIVVSLHFPNSAVDNYAMSKETQTDDNMAYYVHEQLRNIQKDTERLIEEEHNLFEQSLAPEIDIEEITLRKAHSDERLGLTVCYSNGEEYGEGGGSGGSGTEVYGGTSVTEVYISDIHVDSVAGRDGRLRQGDQILQINGKDITTREETETLIAENNNAVTLLISRYLYGEEDDFNDPSTNEDDDEVLVVEDDDDDDDDEEEFYDENNMTYVNCMTSTDCCLNVDDFDKALMSQVEQQPQQCLKVEGSDPADTVILPPTLHKDRARTSKAEKKISSSVRNVSNTTKGSATMENSKAQPSVMAKAVPENKTSDYYESEHIYETIPEDPESEPFYCSPYDSSVYVTAIASCSSSTATTDALQQQMQHKQRVVQWLGINPSQGICNTAMPRQSIRSSSGCGRSLKQRHKTASSTMRSTITSLTNGSVDGIGSAMTLPASAQVDDQDNSSSAYNTGGSNNSVSPHALVLNPKNRPDGYHATGCMPIASAASTDDVVGMQQLLLQHKMVSQQKILSPKDKNKITSPKSGNKLSVMDLQSQANAIAVAGTKPPPMYTNNEANVPRNAMVQQQLMKPTLAMDKAVQQPYYQHQMLDQMHCPQFTAPNLSQYHFVSSQEVNNLSLNNKIPKSSPIIAETASNTKNGDGDEEAMVWKVKRRPDGTRYIVRRPAKSRVIKERNVRLNVERLRDDNTTTEDDTMSEIKTGRYWTREERKKHIEKAKERRQQQQLQYQQQLQQQQKIVHSNATPYEETAATEMQEREKLRHAHFLSFSRQKYRQHYQLQFNSAQAEAAQKHKSSANYHNNATLPTGIHEDGSAGGTDQTDNVLVTTGTTATAVTTISSSSAHLITSSEHNNINNAMISVTTV